MANLFDASSAKEGEPRQITVGDYLQWKRTDLVADYPLGSYYVEYVARITGGGETEVKLPATETTTYLFQIDSVQTSAFTPGHYHWQLEVTELATNNRVVVDRGDFYALADLDVNQADPRIHAEIMVTKIETILQGKADADVQSYSVNGRSLTKMTFAELREARDYYKAEVAAHKAKEDAKRGISGGSTIKVRF